MSLIRNIRKLVYILLLSIVITFQLFATDTSFIGAGSPSFGGSSALDVSFFYDPELMQRLTFGFTDSTDIQWLDNTIRRDSLNLGTQVMPGKGEEARGIGSTNFYWILRTNKPVKAKLFLNGPLLEMSSKNQLDWSISFDSELNGVKVPGKHIDSLYGKANAVEIYSRNGGGDIEAAMDFIPVEIITDYTKVHKETQNYSGNVGVIVETN